MPWFKVDDKLHDHRKARAAGATAMGVWLLAGSWAADNLTDGFVPASVLRRWGRPREAAKLVEVGLWIATEQDGEPGWRFHEWLERQPSRAQKLAERAVRAEAGRSGGLASGRSRREAKPKQSAEGPLEPPSRPVPSVPPTEVHTPPPAAKTFAVRSADADQEFETWWSRYPRKVGKGQARKAYRAAAKKVGPERLLAGIASQADALRSQGSYCPHPSTWLNGERWDDDPPPLRGGDHPLGRRQSETDELFRRAAERMGAQP